MNNFKHPYRLKWLLFLGIFMIMSAVIMMVDSKADKSDLVEIKGTIHSANVYITTHESRSGNRYNFGYRHKSQKSELVFFLEESDKKFAISHNIGEDHSDKEYNRIARLLNRTDSVSVWVRAKDIGEYEPKVFQITGGNTVIVDIKDVTTENIAIIMFMLILGIGCLLLYINSRFQIQKNQNSDSDSRYV